MKLKDRSLQGPFDGMPALRCHHCHGVCLTAYPTQRITVTQDEACRKLLSDWDYAETERLLEERAEAMRIQREERLRTAAERDVAARIALRYVRCRQSPATQGLGVSTHVCTPMRASGMKLLKKRLPATVRAWWSCLRGLPWKP